MNDSRHTVLFVDDEENILHSLKRLLRKEEYRIHTATNGSDGLEIIKKQDVHLVVTDQRMPGMSGTEFLAKVKENYPEVIRIVLSGYTEVDSITESINKGHIYKFMLKPWNDQNLKLEIKQALEQYDLMQVNKTLHEKLIEKNQELKTLMLEETPWLLNAQDETERKKRLENPCGPPCQVTKRSIIDSRFDLMRFL